MVKSMNRFLKASAITLLAAMTLTPLALARDHTVIYYQSPSSTTWYTVSTVRTTVPVFTYTAPGTNNQVYVYQAAAPSPAFGDVKVVASQPDSSVFVDGEYAGTTRHIMRVALEEGNHDMELRDAQGNILFSGSVNVVAGQTTQIRPQ